MAVVICCEQTAPPDVLVRANELAKGSDGVAVSPLRELCQDGSLLESHLVNLPDEKRRNRGEVSVLCARTLIVAL